MNAIIPGLEVELNASPGFDRKLGHHGQERLSDGPIGLPAYSQNPVRCPPQGEPRGLEGVQNLRCGITTEIADACGLFIHRTGQFLCWYFGVRSGFCFVVIILAVEAIKGAGMIEDGKVFVTIFGSFGEGVGWMTAPCPCWADKVPHTIGGKGIVIIGEIPLMGAPTQDLAFFHFS
jgi:hypothetical protein